MSNLLSEAFVVSLSFDASSSVNEIINSNHLLIPFFQVALLSKIPEHARLFDLVQVVASGGMASFSTWCSASPNGGTEAAAEAELSSLGLHYSHCFETMRLLSFCTLASSSKLLSFESIQSALNVSFRSFISSYSYPFLPSVTRL